VVVLLGVAGYFIYTRVAQPTDASGGKAVDAVGRAIPVAAAPARRGDMEIFLNGLGSVTPLNTVTIRTRVDGQLMKVAFIEGRNVREGQPLFEIDPRPRRAPRAARLSRCSLRSS